MARLARAHRHIYTQKIHTQSRQWKLQIFCLKPVHSRLEEKHYSITETKEKSGRDHRRSWHTDWLTHWDTLHTSTLGAIHKLRWQDFSFFLTTYPPCFDIFYGMNVDQNWTFLDHLPSLSCKRSLWTPPYYPRTHATVSAVGRSENPEGQVVMWWA